MSKRTFFQGAVVLAAAGIVIKILGAVFRIPLANMIGSQGMAYYQAAYPVYVFFMMLATAGIPVAISRMVSERLAENKILHAHKVYKVSIILLLIIGVTSSSICFFGASHIVRWINIPGAYYAMRAIAPALLFVSLMAAFRGYFQGMQNMKPTAVSQIIEQFFRVGIGLFLAWYFIKTSSEYAAAGAAFGATIGGIAGLLTVVIIYFKRSRNRREASAIGYIGDDLEPGIAILSKIFVIAVPITIGAAIMPIMNFIDVAIIMKRLEAAGFVLSRAEDLYGQLSGFAGPLINFPQVLTQAVAMSLVPAVAMAAKQKDNEFLHRNVSLGLRTAMMAGFPCAVGLLVLAKPIMMALYPFQRESAVEAAPILMIMAIGVIFLSNVQTLTGILQGVGKQLVPVKNLAIGALFKIIITWWLAGVYVINVKGAAIGTVIAYITAALLNLLAVKKYTGTRFSYNLTYFKPLISSSVMGIGSGLTYKAFYLLTSSNGLSLLLAIIISVFIYTAMLFVTGAVEKEEIRMMPKGDKILRIINIFYKKG